MVNAVSVATFLAILVAGYVMKIDYPANFACASVFGILMKAYGDFIYNKDSNPSNEEQLKSEEKYSGRGRERGRGREDEKARREEIQKDKPFTRVRLPVGSDKTKMIQERLESGNSRGFTR